MSFVSKLWGYKLTKDFIIIVEFFLLMVMLCLNLNICVCVMQFSEFRFWWVLIILAIKNPRYPKSRRQNRQRSDKELSELIIDTQRATDNLMRTKGNAELYVCICRHDWRWDTCGNIHKQMKFMRTGAIIGCKTKTRHEKTFKLKRNAKTYMQTRRNTTNIAQTTSL